MVIEIRIWWITRSWSEMNTVTWSFSCNFNVVYVEWSYPWTFLFLMICVCLCVCVMCFLATCVCVCVCYECYNSARQWHSFVFNPVFQPPSEQSLLQGRQNISSHTSVTNTQPSTRRNTCAHTCTHGRGDRGSSYQISYRPTAYYSATHNFICSR